MNDEFRTVTDISSSLNEFKNLYLAIYLTNQIIHFLSLL